MLIIEGADCVGKTTLAKALTKTICDAGGTHEYKHLQRADIEGSDNFRAYTRQLTVHSVWDRFHPSEPVYRSLDDRPTTMTPLRYELVEAAVRQACGFVVLVLADDKVIRERHGRKAELYDVEHALRANEAYSSIVHCRGIFTSRKQAYYVRYDFVVWESEGCDIDGIAAIYLRQLREYKEITQG